MHNATPIDSSFRGYVSGGARAEVHEADDTKQMQELKITMMKGETRDGAEHPQNYGFNGYPVKCDYKEEDIIQKSAEGFAQFPGGNRSFPVVQNLDDRRFRCRNFDEGEVAMYDDQQQKVHIMRQRIYGRSQFKIEFRVIEDEEKEDGHGKDPKASRDQKKDESRRRSTIVMDEETIVLEKTKVMEPQTQKQQRQPGEDDDYQNDEPEEKYRKDPKVQMFSQIKMTDEEIILTTYRNGDPHLQFKLSEPDNLITMQTLRNGRPNLAWTVDEENGEVTFQASPDLIFEMDDEEKRITLRTEKGERPHLEIELDMPKETIHIRTRDPGGPPKTEILWDNTDSSITMRVKQGTSGIKIDTDVVRLGTEDADNPAAMLGSIDSAGDIIIGNVAQKAMVI